MPRVRAAMTMCLVFVPLLLLAPSAEATSITFSFTGVVDSVDAPLTPIISMSSVLSGSYTFESTTPDANASLQFGEFAGALTAFDVLLGGFVGCLAPSGPENTIGVQDAIPDEYRPFASINSLSSVNGYSPLTMEFDLVKAAGDAWSSDALPLMLPALHTFDSKTWTLLFSNGGSDEFAAEALAVAQGRLTSLQVTVTDAAVPEPSSILLLATGGIGAVARRRFTRARSC